MLFALKCSIQGIKSIWICIGIRIYSTWPIVNNYNSLIMLRWLNWNSAKWICSLIAAHVSVLRLTWESSWLGRRLIEIRSRFRSRSVLWSLNNILNLWAELFNRWSSCNIPSWNLLLYFDWADICIIQNHRLSIYRNLPLIWTITMLEQNSDTSTISCLQFNDVTIDYQILVSMNECFVLSIANQIYGLRAHALRCLSMKVWVRLRVGDVWVIVINVLVSQDFVQLVIDLIKWLFSNLCFMCVLSFSCSLSITDVRTICISSIDGLTQDEHLLLSSLSRIGNLIHCALNSKLSWINSNLLIASKVLI